MNSLILISSFFISSVIAITFKESELDQAWSVYKVALGKKYTDEIEDNRRKANFGMGLKKIQIHNYLYSKGLSTWSMGVNQFTDMTDEELEHPFDDDRPTPVADLPVKKDFPELEQAWSVYKDNFGKKYSYNYEDIQKMDIFGDNLKMIEIHNYLLSKRRTSWAMGINQFTDMTVEEFKNKMNGYKMVRNRTDGVTYLSPNKKINLPDFVDWRTEGYVTPIKNQGECGSCWAFSAAGSIEGQHYRSTGDLVKLSEQNLVDCSGAYGNEGCNGGAMENVFKYVKENGGIDTEGSYPYIGKPNMECRFDKPGVGATVKCFICLTNGNETKLQEMVATVGPVSIAIDASHESFQMYRSGVYNEPGCTGELNHGVLVVGYGTKNGTDYWIVKNSWGTQWGDEGFIYMSRNKNNQCGVASAASYPLV